MTSIHAPGRLTVLAALLASIAAPAFAASDLVISQVSGGGGNSGAQYKNDFVELFNRGTSDINLSGKSVQYAATGGTTWAATALPNKTLAPGQFFLLQLAAGAGGQPLLPTPDHTAGTAMGAAGGKVALSSGTTSLSGASPTAGVLDFLGWGTANFFEGTAAAGVTTNTTAVVRTNACTDTDDNAADFSVAVPVPRNMATTKAPCNGPKVIEIAPVCPGSMLVEQGTNGLLALSASDEDGVVNAAMISAGAPGISLVNFTAAGVTGESAHVSLAVSPSVPTGTYPVKVDFKNSDPQSASCSINVRVMPLPPVTLTIPQIQGSGAASSENNVVHTTEGVVTHTVSSGFFMQDAAGDNNALSSDGIFVYMGNTPAGVSAGELVRVTGTVTEFTPTNAKRSYTELKDATSIFVRGSGYSVAPTSLNSLDNLDRVEGMLVSFTNALTVNQNAYIADRGELTLSVGRRETPTNRFRPGSAEAKALAAANDANVLTLDDGIFVAPTTIPYITDGTLRTGDSVTGLTGVIDFGAVGGGSPGFKLQPTEAPVFTPSNARTPAPVLAAGNVKVASANVLNFFTTFTNGGNVLGQTGQGCTLGATTKASNCRGADNMPEFVRQRDKIVKSLKAIDADVVGLMEIQNNGDYAVSYLVGALNAAIDPTTPTYAYVPAPPVLGTDAIRVAMIYKPAKLSLSGTAMSDGDEVNNRPPMAQTFKAPNGARFSVIVNHMKSKACSGSPSGLNIDQGDGQSCYNLDRVEQATRLANYFIPQVKSVSGDQDVLVIGDLNSHGAEDPILVLTSSGLVNELERHVRPHTQPYSYVFGGLAAYLDHALASPSLDAQVVDATEWHNNADEPEVIDYNIGGKPQDLYASNAYRASDHDPVVVSLNLPASYANVSTSFSTKLSGPAYNRVSQRFTGTYSFTNKTASAITGPFQVTFANLPAGVTLDNANGQFNGVPYITANTASIAPGATVTVSMTFSNPAKSGISFSNTIYSGTF